MSRLNPLSPITYCRRNLTRILPMSFVIVLSVFLIASVVTIVNSIDLTVSTIYNYTKIVSLVIPQRSELSVDDADVAISRSMPNAQRVIPTGGFFMNIRTVFGEVPFIAFGLTDADRDYVLGKSGDRLSSGRMPMRGRAEAVLSSGLVRNKHLKLGDIVAGPEDSGGVAGTPVPVKLVGILSGPTWIAFTSKSFVDSALPFMPRFLIITSSSRGSLAALSTDLDTRLHHDQVSLLSYRNLVTEVRGQLSAMYLIMTLVNAMVILVVALMSGMLSNIYFTQRISEFAILSAIGVRRTLLLWHAVSETAVVTAIGWFFGVVLTWLVMSAMRGTVFEPRGMLIDPRDTMAFLSTIPIPIIITAFAVGTIAYRLATLDPVTIIERR